MPEPIVDPKVDPKPEPIVTPPEGDNPPAGEEHDANYWSQKYGDSENEKGVLREQIETEKANTLFFQQQAQNAQAQPPTQNNQEISLDPMEADFGKNLVGVMRTVYREENARRMVETQIDTLVQKHGMTQIAAQNVLNFGYQHGANSPEQAMKLYAQNFGNQLIPNPNPDNGNPDPNPNPNPAPNNNQVRYHVPPPTVPTGGDLGSGSGLEKAPSYDDWANMSDEQKRAYKQKVKDGKIEFNSDNAVHATPTN